MHGPRRRTRRLPVNSDDTPASYLPEGPDIAVSLAADSPVLAVFKDAAMRLTERHERHLRFAKWSGDITVESKSIILLLLNSPKSKESSENTITEARKRIQKLTIGPLKSIGLELEKCPAHLHRNILTTGFQDYVVARTFLSLMSEKRIVTYAEIQKEIDYNITEDDQQRPLVTFLPILDYMLGLAELTGVLKMKAINSIYNRDMEEFQASDVLRQLYSGFLGITHDHSALYIKLEAASDNMDQADMAMYTLYFRDGVAPAELALPTTPALVAPPGPSDVDDEGYHQECT